MNLLGRINLKTPEMITISFEDNPSAIKAAKIALQNAAICANPQQDGVVLFVPVPKMTRERREQLAENAKKILNDYKKALNNVCPIFYNLGMIFVSKEIYSYLELMLI